MEELASEEDLDQENPEAENSSEENLVTNDQQPAKKPRQKRVKK